MSEQHPAPFTPPDCDLNGLEFMPLEVNRVMQSTLFGLSSGDEFKAAFALWCAAWYECPAASLPNDERMLEYLSRSKTWKKVRAVAMRGWVLCSDGRLYHETIAKVALSAWDRRVVHREENDSKAERQRRWRERCKHLAQMLRDRGITPPKGASLETLERLLVDAGVDVSASTRDAGEIGKTGEDRGGEDRGGQGIKSNTSEASPLHPAAASPAAGTLPGVEPPPPPEDPGPPPCPHDRVIALYAKHLPQLAQPRVWEGARAEALRVRWRRCSQPTAFGKGYATVEEGIAFWDKFFRFVATCPALRDGIDRGNGSRWFADLPWLLKAENFAKVIEGKYTE